MQVKVFISGRRRCPRLTEAGAVEWFVVDAESTERALETVRLWPRQDRKSVVLEHFKDGQTYRAGGGR